MKRFSLRRLTSRWWLTTLGWAVRLIAVLFAVVTARTMGEPLPADRLVLTPCHLDSLAEEVLCGIHEVYEKRTAMVGRRIPVHVAVLPPLRRSAARDPLFILMGGPGQGARSFAPVAARYFKGVRRSRAIVLVDLRGTGASGPLECRQPDETAALALGPDSHRGHASACLEDIDADPRHYTHASALADLDEVRSRLGYERINIWGGSWGTRAGMLYALTYPHAVRSVVLDGAVSFEESFPRGVARNAQRAMDRLIERCTEDPGCATTFPDPGAELRTLLARLDRGPITVTMRNPRTGVRAPVTLTRDAVAEIIRVALYTPLDAVRLLQGIRHAVQGDYAPIVAQYVHSASSMTDDMALGLTMSILCSEDWPLVAEASFDADSRDTFLRTGYADAWRSRCRVWPAGPPIAVDRQASSNAPALILSGEQDPVTPPASGEAMGRRFPRSVHVVVPGAAHNASFIGCAPDLIATFLDLGTTDLDTTCVRDVPLPAIVVSDAGGRP
jgi:pimeloyl-ACP methyl ester carboxylesterase